MIGQGCPSDLTVLVPRRESKAVRRWATALACAVVVLFFGSHRANGVGQQASATPNIGLRIVWGGAKPMSWTGSITLSSGDFDNLVPLGLAEDDNVAIAVSGSMLRVRQLTPSTFNGCDVRANAGLDATLTLDLTSIENSSIHWRQQGTLRDFIAGSQTFELDGPNHRLAIQRVPGDEIQLEFEQDRMVFSTSVETHVRVRPAATGFTPLAEGKLRVAMIEEATGTRTTAAEISIKADDVGEIPPIEPISLRIPDAEGVYDWEFSLVENQKRGPFTAERALRTRRVQCIAIDGKTTVDSPPQEWQEAFAIDPTHPDHWTMRRQINQLKLPTRYPALIGNGVGVEQVGKQSMVQLAPKGWQAIAIPIDQPNTPHIIEMEYVSSRPCSLGLSLLEPNALGFVPNLGVDSGIIIPSSTVQEAGDSEPTIEKHRITIWPRSKLPYLILANHDEQRTAVFGRIRVLNGPPRLPLPTKDNPPRENSIGRQRMLLLERPTMVQVMNAPQVLDEDNHQLFEDWKTVYTACDRLVQYLKSNGYSGLVMAVAADGSAIYPSPLIQPTPRWDGGVYSASGQDPVRKDVLDLMFRMFDRAGLKLIPIVELSNRIPSLEAQRVDNAPAPFDLVDQGGQVWHLGSGPKRRPPYNPLHASVQTEFARLVDEICGRYARYSSFAGLGLAVNDQTALSFPDETWGWDPATVQEFLADAKISRATFQNASSRDSLNQLLADHRDRWNTWRANRLTELFIRLQARVAAIAPSGRLYLIPTNSSDDTAPMQSIGESVEGIPKSERMANMGIDADALHRSAQVTLMDSMSAGLGESSVGLRSGEDPDVDQGQASAAGVMFEHLSSWAHFEQFEQLNPIGATAPIIRIQQLTPGGMWNRRRYAAALARVDCTVLFDGGSTVPLGQEESTSHWAEAFRAIPAVPFQSVYPKGNHRADPLIVRQHQAEAQTYFYVVNDSPWPVDALIDLAGSNLGSLRSLTSRRLAASVVDDRGQLIAAIPPFEIIVAAIDGPAEVADYRAQLPIHSGLQMQREIQELKWKLGQGDAVDTAALLENPSFEDLTGDGKLAGWQIGPNNPQIGLDSSNPYDGSSALSMRAAESPVWARSSPFSVPRTDRLTVSVWLHPASTDREPILRVSMHPVGGEPDSHFRAELVKQNDSGSSDAWQQYVAQFESLPDDLRDWQVEFELMKSGAVWIDRVAILDRWLAKDEVQSLKQLLNLASYKLQEQGDSVGCLRILESYWPRYVADRFAASPSEHIQSALNPNGAPSADQRK